jgi:hypothetical protein
MRGQVHSRLEASTCFASRVQRFDPSHVQKAKQCADASAQALWRLLLEGIQDGHVEVREITFVPSGHGETMNASRGGHHGVLT